MLLFKFKFINNIMAQWMLKFLINKLFNILLKLEGLKRADIKGLNMASILYFLQKFF